MCCSKYPCRWSSVMPTTGAPTSAAERSVSPASTPRPPLYVGIACSRLISIEKYATVVDPGVEVIARAGVQCSRAERGYIRANRAIAAESGLIRLATPDADNYVSRSLVYRSDAGLIRLAQAHHLRRARALAGRSGPYRRRRAAKP